jgi:uncharacterized membrane protein YkgB
MSRLEAIQSRFFSINEKFETWGMEMLRVSLAIVFIWFGALKIWGESPAHDLVKMTVFWFPDAFFVPFLGFWEVAMGLGLLIRRLIPFTIIPLLFHMACTFLPFIVAPEVCFDVFPFVPSLVGQYIIKNLVLIAGVLYVSGKYSQQMRQSAPRAGR